MLRNHTAVLTLHQVLLYNFFENSTADLSQWRVVLNTLPEKKLGLPAPRFSDIRHAAICSEVRLHQLRLNTF